MKRSILVPVALVGALAIGGGTAGAASPVQGSISGPVTAVSGKTFTVKTPANLGVPKNTSKVTVVSSTVITEQGSGTRASIKKGLCVTAIGAKSKKGVVTAQRVTLRAAVKGSCTNAAFGRGGGAGRRPPTGTNPNRPPGGTGTGTGQRPPGSGGFGRNANFGFASGTVTAVKGSTVSVKGQTGTTSFVLAKTTQIDQTLTVTAKAIKAKLCVFVNGTSPDKGATVTAQSIALTKPTSGGCFAGFRGRGGGP
jgi:Domain of unknown function (DUF5666)